MRTLRTTLLLAIFACLSYTASAQFQFGAGAALDLDLNEFGVEARGQYGFNDTWRGAADFILFFPGEGVNAFSINANAHYIFVNNPDALSVYGLAGLNFTRVSVDLGPLGGLVPGNISATDTGLNVGGGVNIPLGGRTGFAEVKYGIGGSELGIAAGILFGGN